MVGASGFEPPASWSRTRRSSQAEPRPERKFAAYNSLRCIACDGNALLSSAHLRHWSNSCPSLTIHQTHAQGGTRIRLWCAGIL